MARTIIQYASKASQISGGALKIRHYFEHALSLFPQRTRLYMPKDLVWTSENPFTAHRQKVVHNIDWSSVSTMVITGQGWEWFIPEKFHYQPPFRVIYLVQGFEKFLPHDPRFPSFRNPAIRICVSESLADKLRSLGIANGPIHAIPAGISLEDIRVAQDSTLTDRNVEILVLGVKRPQIGQRIADKARALGKEVCLLTQRLPREAFLQHMADARIVVCLPQDIEGWYLPALEAMAMGALTIIPSVVGNTYCIHGENCLIPKRYEVASVVDMIKKALSFSPLKERELVRRAKETAIRYNLRQERMAFQKILNGVDQMARKESF